MMFLVRSAERVLPPKSVEIKVARRTPAIVPHGAGKTDYFCVGEVENIAALRTEGWEVVELRDGWYEDDEGGGIAIFGHGRYWELRDTPFTVKERVSPAGERSGSTTGVDEQVNVRQAIFGV